MKHVVLMEKDSKRYIEKQILADIDLEMCLSKMAYVNYLADHGVPAARIIGYEERDGRIFERQEYVEPCGENLHPEDYIRMLARFHIISGEYSGEFLQKKVLKDRVLIAGAELNQVLVGFYEKYYEYAHNVFDKKELRRDLKESVFRMHDSLYEELCKVSSLEECIVHNDLSPDNMVCHSGPVLIDFDLAVKSSVYVDVADVLFPKTLGISDYLPFMEDKALERYASLYNRINDRVQLTARGIKLMAALKLFTYLMYIYSQNHVFSSELLDYLKRIYQEAVSEQ